MNKHYVKHISKYLIFFILFIVSFSKLSQGNDKVVLQLHWKHQFQFAGYYAALEKGYYKDEGLDVEIREFDGKNSPIDQVLEGDATFGIGNSDILVRYMNGDPIVAIAPFFQTSPEALLVRGNSDISQPTDLEGKKIELNVFNAGSTEILAMLQLQGLKPSHYEVVQPSYTLNNLLNNKADALEIYLSNEPFFLDKFGIPYKVIKPSDYGVDFYAECLFTTSVMANNHPRLVNRFLKATIKGWEYAIKNPEEIARLIQNKYKSTKTLEYLISEATAINNFIKPDFVNIGHSNKGRWISITEVLLNAGLISKTRSIDDFLFTWKDTEEFYNTLIWFIGIGIFIAICVAIGLMFLLGKRKKKYNSVISRLRSHIDSLNLEGASIKDELAKYSQRNKELENFKESLLGNVSFEIRTPLNNIVGYSELLTDPRLKQGQILQYTKEINKSSRILQYQIDNIIDLSKLESNQQKIVYSRINLNDFFNNLQLVLLNELKLFDKETLTIKAFVDDDITFDILSDKIILKNIFVRLINNSVKFTSKGYIEIGCKKKDEDSLLFWVQDSGSGIPNEKLADIFNPNHPNIDNSLSLGLPIVYRFIEMLNGKIWIDTDDNAGTTISVELPFTPIGSPRKKTELTAYLPEQTPPDLQGKSVLIVEDVQSNYVLLNKMLEGTGCSTLHAHTGFEATKLFNDNPNIDIVFMDLRLSDADGVELTRQMRQINTKVVIIAQTAYSSGVKVNLSIEAGCNDFITKPISRIELYNILRKFLL